MSTLRMRVLIWAAGVCLVLGLVIAPALTQTQTTSPTDQHEQKEKVQEGYNRHR
jgi:hypothetical protein